LHGAPELAVLGVHRARFCELAAPAAGRPAGEQYLIGLLSVMDALLQIPMERVVPMLPLRPEASAALSGQPGMASVPLRLLKAYESKDWAGCEELCGEIHICDEQLFEMYAGSLRWAVQQVRESRRRD
jgi:EAL and modified HD-GYP domain-containing signal transduction protein